MARNRSRRKNVERTSPKAEKVAFVGDVHIPYHDPRAVDVVLSFLDWFKPDTLFLIGDIIDFYQLSRYDKDPDRLLGLQSELDQTVEFISRCRNMVGDDCRIVYREGNHELRLTTYLRHNPEIAKLRSIQLGNLLEFSQFRIEHCEYMGKLSHRGFLVEHGDVVRKHSAYTARGMLEKRGISGITGHTHRLGSHYVTNAAGTHVWFENGCLCSLEPEYILGIPNWQHGFSVGWTIEGDNRFTVEQVPVVKHRIYYQGSLWA